MAEIECTIKEFHKFIGPRIRNMVQLMTKKRKKDIKHLEAAHVKGNSRKDLINVILKKYTIDEKNQLVKVDLEKFEREIIEAHKPLDNYFRFLCVKCHKKYDSKNELSFKEIEIAPTLTTSRPKVFIDTKVNKLYKLSRK